MITRKFITDELGLLQSEIEKAKTFLIQTEAVSNVYKMLLTKVEDEYLPETPETRDESSGIGA